MAAFIWPAARIPAQDRGQPKLISTVRKKIWPEGPTRVFKLYAVAACGNYHYRVDVCDAGGSVVLQGLEEIRNGIRLEGRFRPFQVVDVNFDGYADLKVLAGYSEGRAWYKVWLYDAGRQRYVWVNRDP
jgi:hypothetical protein